MLNVEQTAALLEIQQLVLCSGLSPDQLSALSPTAPSELSPSSATSLLLGSPSLGSQHPVFIASTYVPLPACHFTPSEVKQGHHCANHKTSVDAIVEHPKGAIVEYPQTGEFDKGIVAHIFHINPVAFHHLKSSFQYSLGDGHGGLESVKCFMLRDSSNHPVQCKVLKTLCKYYFHCLKSLSLIGTYIP